MQNIFKHPLILWILIAAIAIRLLVFFILAPWDSIREADSVIVYDAEEYHLCAKNLLLHKRFSADLEAPFEPHAYRTPGYPLFIAFHYFLFGIKPWIVLLSQIFLQILLFVGIFVFCRFLKLSFRSTSIACLIIAFDPASVIMPSRLYTEAIFTILIFYSVFFLILHTKRTGWFYAIISSLLLSIAIYYRPGALFLIPVYVIILFIFPRGTPWMKIVSSSIFIIICLSMLAPWCIRNKIVFNRVAFSDIFFHHLRFQAEDTLVEAKKISNNEANRIIDERLLFEFGEGITDFRTSWDRHEKYAGVYKSIIAENFIYFLRASTRNALSLYVLPGNSKYVELMHGVERSRKKTIFTGEFFWHMEKKGLFVTVGSVIEKQGMLFFLFLLLVVILNLAMLFFACVGVKVVWGLDKAALSILLVIFLSFTLFVGTALDVRYKLPSFWIVAILSGAGLDFYIAASKRRIGHF